MSPRRDGLGAEVLDLFERGHRDPPSEPVDTSIMAAADARPTAGTQRRRLYDVIKRRGSHGATDDELEVLTGLSHHTVSPRRRELVLAGMVRDSGHRRDTRRGRAATVWELGLDLDPGEDRGGPMVRVPDKVEIKLALRDMRRMWKAAREAGVGPANPREVALVGRWLRAVAGEDLSPKEERDPSPAMDHVARGGRLSVKDSVPFRPQTEEEVGDYPDPPEDRYDTDY